jgi:dihydroorotate dehydrogenase (NAD+) catalytic subunit
MSSPVMIRGAATLSSALAEFQAYLNRKNLNAAELIGVAADRRRPFPAMPLKTDNWKKYVST